MRDFSACRPGQAARSAVRSGTHEHRVPGFAPGLRVPAFEGTTGRVRRTIVLIVAAIGLVFATSAFAVEPDEILKDPALETRARSLSQSLRCMVCQNESIDESNAPLARDLRLLVRERIQMGDSDRQVREFLVARYGEFILLEPRLTARTWLLWSIPLMALLAGVASMLLAFRRRPSVPAPLTDEEKRRLSALLDRNNKA
jgi:cytochrome c-type biogenesis protein CcmH